MMREEELFPTEVYKSMAFPCSTLVARDVGLWAWSWVAPKSRIDVASDGHCTKFQRRLHWHRIRIKLGTRPCVPTKSHVNREQ